MLGLLKRLWNDRRGNALIIAGAALPLVVGAAGLATDTIQWTTWKRQLQRTADSAAMAGAYARVSGNAVGSCNNWTTATYADPVGFDVLTNNHLGFSGATCAVENSPASGAFTADPNAVRVTMTVQKKLGFSSLFMTAAPTIAATATATVVPSGEYCVISLENTSATGITATGSATVDLGCGMITNSTSMTAAVATGSSSVTASPIAAVGGIDASNNWGAGTILQPFTIAQADPFENVYPPVPSGCQKFSSLDIGGNNKPGGTVDLTTTLAPGGTYCIKENSGSLDIKGNVTLPSGTYVLDATSLSMTNTSAALTCHECTFILTSSTAATNPGSIGNVSLQGGKLDLTSASSGTYQGLMFYQDRRAPSCGSAGCKNIINGNSSSSLLGAAYFPSQELQFNGTAGMTTDCLQLVARNVSYSGNMDISNTCDKDSGASSFAGRKVRLVE